MLSHYPGLSSHIHLPAPLPSARLCFSCLLQPAGHNGTMRALTPAGFAHTQQVSLLTPFCLPDIPPPNTRERPDITFAVTSVCPVNPANGRGQVSPWTRRLTTLPRRNGFVILRAAGSLPVALHPASRRTQLPSASCNVTSHDKDSNSAGRTYSQTHGSRLKAGMTIG